jgi:hypothetical protein
MSLLVIFAVLIGVAFLWLTGHLLGAIAFFFPAVWLEQMAMQDPSDSGFTIAFRAALVLAIAFGPWMARRSL